MFQYISRLARALVRPVRTTRLLAHRIRTWLRDRRYGGYAGSGPEPNRISVVGYLFHKPSDYADLDRLFSRVPVGPADVLVDVGCGRGRVLNFWLGAGLGGRLVGIEFDPELAGETRARLANQPRVTVLTGDALELIPPEGTIFYLFRPFNRQVSALFMERLLAVKGGHPFTVIYNCVEAPELFTEDPRWRAELLNPADGLTEMVVIARPAHAS